MLQGLQAVTPGYSMKMLYLGNVLIVALFPPMFNYHIKLNFRGSKFSRIAIFEDFVEMKG